jgi:dTDP-4-amino-4,6-dideoxygalactose transaminase
MSELHAAMGLSVFHYVDQILNKRKDNFNQFVIYFDEKLSTIRVRKETLYNYSYIPIIFSNPEQLNLVKLKLEANNIFPRRYFYPSLNTLNYIVKKENFIVSEGISNRILCLPNYFELTKDEIQNIAELILSSL